MNRTCSPVRGRIQIASFASQATATVRRQGCSRRSELIGSLTGIVSIVETAIVEMCDVVYLPLRRHQNVSAANTSR